MSPPSHPALQRVRSLDRSSPDFHDQLSKVLGGEEYKRSVPELRRDDSVWLINYLDKVRCPVAIPHSPLKPV